VVLADEPERREHQFSTTIGLRGISMVQLWKTRLSNRSSIIPSQTIVSKGICLFKVSRKSVLQPLVNDPSVQSCWNGIAVLDPAPFYEPPHVKFRMARLPDGECSASECSLICSEYLADPRLLYR
jgi:hypothetical protein